MFSADGSTERKTTLIVTPELFTELTGIRDRRMVSLQLTSDFQDDDLEILRGLLGNGYVLSDQRDTNNHGTYLAFLFCVYAFLGIIALVAVLNIVNCISMSVSARVKQYGIMRAVGMENGQLLRMITAEGLTYGLTGCVIRLVIGLPLSRWLYAELIEKHFAYARYQFSFFQVLIITIFIGVSVLIGVRIAMRQVSKQSIVDLTKAL